MLKDNLIELEKFPGFYKIPHKPEYAIFKRKRLIDDRFKLSLISPLHKLS